MVPMSKDSLQINILREPQIYRLDGQTWRWSKKEIPVKSKKLTMSVATYKKSDLINFWFIFR